MDFKNKKTVLDPENCLEIYFSLLFSYLKKERRKSYTKSF
jgi:hypothetical protein